MNHSEIKWNPTSIGLFKSEIKNRYEAPRQASLEKHTGVIEFNSRMNYEQALRDLEGIERIWVIYLFHLNQDNWKPMVNPPRNSHSTKRGVFSTRAPYRPNPIGLSCVRVLRIKGLKIYVEESDILDQTPILDIKPYIPYADSFPNSKVGWLENLEQEAHSIEWHATATEQAVWLGARGIIDLEAYVRKQLEYQPLNTRHKRIRQLEKSGYFSLGYRTWRLQFILLSEMKSIQIISIHSGYTEYELDTDTDAYSDKDIHRQYCLHFSSSSIGSEQKIC